MRHLRLSSARRPLRGNIAIRLMTGRDHDRGAWPGNISADGGGYSYNEPDEYGQYHPTSSQQHRPYGYGQSELASHQPHFQDDLMRQHSSQSFSWSDYNQFSQNYPGDSYQAQWRSQEKDARPSMSSRSFSTNNGRRYHERRADSVSRGREKAMSIDPESESYDTRLPKQAQNMTLPAVPDHWYLTSTMEGPETFPSGSLLPKPLPLLILDLNGTLVYRSGRDANSSRRPNLRPYLSNFLQYCLAVRVEQEKHDERMKQWKDWDQYRLEQSNERRSELRGTHFWSNHEAPVSLPGARYRLLVWSSAQPHNVDSMVRACLPPAQAEQLLRVYARDTLIIQKLFKHKSPSVKDLDVIWSTLNQAGSDNAADLAKAEARLIAEERSQQDSQNSRQYRKISARLWQRAMEMPKYDSLTGTYRDGQGYGPHNTLLLDDSLDKARLQPYNHLLLPEYDASRANVVKKFKKEQDLADLSDKSEENSTVDNGEANLQDGKEGPEDILLQAVGVLEHARKHVNMASWIRYGGLGNFGNMAQQFPLRTLNEASWRDVNLNLPSSYQLNREEAEDLMRKWGEYFSKPSDYKSGIRFRTRVRDRTPAWWTEEGRRALSEAGITPTMFM